MTPEEVRFPPPALSVVICTLDESDCIGAVLRELREALAGLDYEVLVVDDSSDELTAGVVLAHAAGDRRVRLLRRYGARGLASAAIAGWEAARGGMLAIMDGDGQHDPHLLPKLVQDLVGSGADMAVASRYAAQGGSGLSGRRHLVSRAGTLLTHAMLGVHSTDPLSGLFVMTRTWFERARPRLSGVGFKILVDLLASGRRRPQLVEVSTALRARHGGSSKLDSRVIVELAALLLEKRTGGMLSARFGLFAAVGSTGVAVHLGVLAVAKGPAGLPFWAAQGVATIAAMTSNFFLNNALTFRDRRLSGRALWPGLLTFYASCAGGAALSEAAGSVANGLNVPWMAAGIIGAAVASLWNYAAAKNATWRADRPGPAPSSLGSIPDDPGASRALRLRS